MKPAGSSGGYSQQVHHGLPKQAKELGIHVTDDSSWKPMGAYHIVYEEARRIGSVLLVEMKVTILVAWSVNVKTAL